MHQAIPAVQQEVLHIRAAVSWVKHDINAHVQQVVQNQVATIVRSIPGNQEASERARAKATNMWREDPKYITLNNWQTQLMTYFECTNTHDLRRQVLVGAGCLREAVSTW